MGGLYKAVIRIFYWIKADGIKQGGIFFLTPVSLDFVDIVLIRYLTGV